MRKLLFRLKYAFGLVKEEDDYVSNAIGSISDFINRDFTPTERIRILDSVLTNIKSEIQDESNRAKKILDTNTVILDSMKTLRHTL